MVEVEYIFYATNGNKEFIVKPNGEVVDARNDLVECLGRLLSALETGNTGVASLTSQLGSLQGALAKVGFP